MQASNSVDASGQNGQAASHDKPAASHDKTPEEIQLEIARTRSAITGDLLALSEKLSPAHLREGAREVMRDAREEAKEVLREAKDAAFESLRGVKDRALASVNETIQEFSLRTRDAGSSALTYASAHKSTAISLLSVSAGLLVWVLRVRSQRAAYARQEYANYDYDRRMERDLAPQAMRQEEQYAHTRPSRAQRPPPVRGGNRLAILSVVVAAGLGFGLLLPLSKRS